MHTQRRSEAALPKKKAETELAPHAPKAAAAEIKTRLLFIIGSLIIRLGTAQRHVAAAFVVSAQNFSGSHTLVDMLVAVILGLLTLMPAARQLGALYIIIRWRLENCMPHQCETTT